ncbi:U3-containing 90S preribosome subunit [Komagataella phaffii CBS 7435]|uniref:Nucleolar protein 9 n=2 Tax=Komagataella phaffii TaxID=460519 RepID=NOP9_KOMPG|nr:uncharacterized protein PAS_chr4_0742 [Komagataella phaffii GS115]C4R8S9.1 RecName: Full=Nucleolar protein 9; AltName: Full=Pumilio domain-containing protein NOP9 [Komagataella phaffii GS115]AOA65358.1 GQ67_05125T0 [Komagataella phaffii]CAH2450591.1 U3-containing 90S preribosome subunit [Komagataella phaffii CBS 7435]AOA70311.1 GQ68_05107T0 [Komagataella phaffii GS115]CAY72004.1 Essential component of pre-40S ribosomes [Komagataella phaffii GS115]CCA40393.1 U3-containing 90S preribosome su
MAKERGRRNLKKIKESSQSDSLKTLKADPSPSREAAQIDVNTFFGLVNSEELDYFKQAESTLNANAFENSEERQGFVSSVFEEAKGKELKLVTNQICSKLMERLILNGSDRQVKRLFKAFNGHFLSLAVHKYSSHVLETLFIRSASVIENELLNNYQEEEAEEEESDEVFATMENMFLFMLAELSSSIQKLIVHQYGSHVIRLLLLIVGARELPSSIMSNSILRSKKSKIARKMIEIKDNQDSNRAYQVPAGFKNELQELLGLIAKDKDSKQLRELAIDKIASPVIQLCIQLEGLVDKDRTIWTTIFPEVDDKDPKEEAFVEYLLSDPIGSHFFQAAIKYQKPKTVHRLYDLYIKDRLLKLAKRETTGAFVVKELLGKLKATDVTEMLDILIPHLSELIENNLEIGQAIVDASIARNNYGKEGIISQFLKVFNDANVLESVLKLSTSTLGNTKNDWPTAEERRCAIFLEKLVEYDDSFLDAVIAALLELPEDRFIQMCMHGVFSHVVESVLVIERVDIVKRRRLLNIFTEHVVTLSCNAYGSHIMDKLWQFSIKLNLFKDRIALALFENKDKIKDSIYGKLVWKNWSMELYCRRMYDWKNLIKQQELELFPDHRGAPTLLKKRPLEEPKKVEEKKDKSRGRRRYH